jgi:2-C-methyl-D-erythritol 4-phosphate cytidylyltransferase
MKKAALLVAGGSGVRMGSSIPKQFLLLNGSPVLMHTIRRFYDYENALPIYVVLPESQLEKWKSLVAEFNFRIKHEIISGGETRQQSVKNGLAKIDNESIVAIHDGVRPLCTPALIAKCFSEAEKFSNAIPALSASDSIRMITEGKSNNIDRDRTRLIQTPQCFHSKKIKLAYERTNESGFTDDASVFENDGNEINLVDGDRSNIKITHQADLDYAAILEKKIFT